MITKIGESVASEDRKPSVLNSYAGVASGTLPGKFIGLALGNPVASILNNAHNGFTNEESERLIKNMTGKANPDLQIYNTDYGVVSHYNPNKVNRFAVRYSPFFSSVPEGAKNYVLADKNSYVLAHELGHATGPMHRLGILKYPYQGMYAAGKMSGIPLALRAFRKEYENTMRPGSYDENDHKVLNTAANVSDIGNAVMLGEEAQASIRGLNQIKKLQGWGGVRNAAKLLAPAYATYGALAATNHWLAPRVAGSYGRWLAKQHMKEQNNAE